MRDSEKYTPLPTKGKTPQGYQIIMFDAVRPCRENRCPIHDLCPYTKAGKCKIETTYLDAVFKSLCSIVRNKLTQELLNKFTLHLLPLHHQLIKFKIKAYSVEDVCFTTVQGGVKMHPIFKEIRETIKQIENTQKSMGFDLEYVRALGLLGKVMDKDPDKYGDPDYWDDWRGELQDDVFPDGQTQNVKRAESDI